MEALASRMQPFFAWLVQTTWVASILICLILAAQKLLGSRLGPRWCHALWLVLLVRMVLPWTPSSPVSLLSLIPDSLQRDASHAITAPLAPPEYLHPGVDVPNRTATATAEPAESSALIGAQSRDTARAAHPSTPLLIAMRRMLPALWLAGALALGGCLFVSNFALWRVIRHEQPLLDQPTLTLFERCKAQMGTETLAVLVSSEQVKTPALFGFLRPRLLLPRQMVETADPQELRYVFLHELGHLKRHDICLGWLTSVLQILHWFNPLIWLAFHRMRTDRELACDALVLTHTGRDESYEYGQTMVGLLKRFSRPRRLPALAGILESKSQLKRRIAMIARFQDYSYRWSPAALVTILAAVCLALPGAAKNAATASEKPAAVSVTPTPAQQPTFRKIRSHNSYDAQSSSDGKSIAFGRDGKLWIIPHNSTAGVDDSDAAQLVNTGEVQVDSYGLAWSADGQWIAFNGQQPVLAEKREGNYRMYVVSAQGGRPKEVYEAYRGGPVHNRQMSLSPNGALLAFSAVDANELHIYTIPVEGGVPRRLVDAPAREPVFSPDGKLIAYVEDKDLGQGGGSLWVVPTTGGTARRVADAKFAWSPIWSPDGRKIAFFDRRGGRQICIVAVNGRGEPVGERTNIDYPEETGVPYRLTGWTPDDKIGAVFESPAQAGLYALALEGGPATVVIHPRKGGLLQPRWSPDGKRILYMRWPQEDGSNWLHCGLASIAAEGGEETTIPIESDTKIWRATWGGGGSVSPDGKTIVFAGCKEQEAAADTMHIWTFPAEGGRPTQLTRAPAPLTDRYPCWSPDGKAIAFVRSRDSQNIVKMLAGTDIFIIPSTGGEARRLTSEADRVIFCPIAWSPDGKLLAYQSKDDVWSPGGGTLRIIPAQGGDSRVVVKLRRTQATDELAWSPDSRRIALNDGGIRIISLNDGHVVDLNPGVAATRIYHFDWSRDGEKLVFVGLQGGEREFWLMENFLPSAVGAKESR